MKQLQVLDIFLLTVGLLGKAISHLLVGKGKRKCPQVMPRSQSFSQ